MSVFELYLHLGIGHITDWVGYDHILFITTLCAVYQLVQWKDILILITAFTLGHTITLALAILEIINVSPQIIEFLIPLTIFLTAIVNIFQKSSSFSKAFKIFKYSTALGFGLIHGLGFSNYLRLLLGNEESIIKPLFAFNIGLEIGQLMIVASVLLLTLILVKLAKVPHREWNLTISGAGLGISLVLMIERFPF